MIKRMTTAQQNEWECKRKQEKALKGAYDRNRKATLGQAISDGKKDGNPGKPRVGGYGAGA